MIFCKDTDCKDCLVKAACINVPPCTEQEFADLLAKVRALKKKAEMLEIDPRELLRSLYG